MGMSLKTAKATPSVVVFQKVLETARGGFKLETEEKVGTLIQAGVPVLFDESTRTLSVLTAETAGLANGLLYDDVIVSDSDHVDAVVRGTVYARRIPIELTKEQKDELIKALPLIIFSESY